MTSNEAYNTTNMAPMYEEIDISGFDGQREVLRNDPIYEDMGDDSPTSITNLQPHLSAEQDGAVDSQRQPRNVVSSPSPLPAEQDGAFDSQRQPRNVVSSPSPLPAEQDGVADTQIANRNVVSCQSPLPAEQDDVADSQIAPRNVGSLQPPLPAEEDDLTDSQLTFNPAYDAIDQQEQILAMNSENIQEETRISGSEGSADITP